MNKNNRNQKIVEVSAAVMQKPDGSFLLAERPEDKIWAGYWEFPGGKIESGETPYKALVRELREELGITVETAYPWITRVFTYPHAQVRLHFFRVTAWRGELHPHEGQRFEWQFSPDISVTPLLPANIPVLRVLSLPPLYAISNINELGEIEFFNKLKEKLVGGIKMVQLREKNLSRIALREIALKIQPMMRQHDARLIINADIELAQELEAGVQLTAGQLVSLDVRPDVCWCAASCHNAEELRRAEELGCDFAMLSPVMPTMSHPGEPTLGWQSFSDITRGTSIPVYALGGLMLDDMQNAWQHGAHGIALLRQAWVS
ncbi:MAG: Nudix family hydrolase [Gallionella sp.]